MYIRWIRRHHKNESSHTLVFHDAYLVESARNEHGQPRQRVICFLGNFREFDGAVPLEEWALFLSHAEQALAQAAARSQVDVERMLNLLEQHAPAYSPEDVASLLRAQVTRFYRSWGRYGRGCPQQELARITGAASGEERSRTA